MPSGRYLFRVTLFFDVEARSAGGAKDAVGELVEVLPIRLYPLLARHDITAHDFAVRFAETARVVGPGGAPAPKAHGAQAAGPEPFRVPVDAKIETVAQTPLAARVNLDGVLQGVAAAMGNAFERAGVASLVARVPDPPELVEGRVKRKYRPRTPPPPPRASPEEPTA